MLYQESRAFASYYLFDKKCHLYCDPYISAGPESIGLLHAIFILIFINVLFLNLFFSIIQQPEQ